MDIQSDDHRDLLDIIDRLRAQGITRWVDLPEIIVCGDQSSGKSSVLEAISRMSFPTKDNLCTRFATELVLRRSEQTGTNVSLIPDCNRPEAEQKALLAVQFDLGDPPNLGKVVDAAKVAMGLDGEDKAFSHDVLRVELSGPDQPHLTMVDLPGLFQAGNKDQSEKDVDVVKGLVESYMKRPRSIILAVVSAKSDFALQAVTALARKHDPRGERTLGLITKPDTLDAGSDSERAYVELAQNKDVKFRLGWHVLKNRDYQMRHATAAERDKAEEEFLSRGIWTSLEPYQLGVKPLKLRLSNVLKNQILKHLPALVGDVEAGIDHCSTSLAKLGVSRSTLSDQRRYLGKVGQEFSKIMQAAVDGDYINNSFFGNAWSSDGYGRRLRALVQNTLTAFEEHMRQDGQAQALVDDDHEELGDEEEQSRKVSRSKFVDDVLILMRRNRGRELPGTWNPLIVVELFRKQCQPWKEIIAECTDDILEAVYRVINEALTHISVGETTDGIRRDIINPKMDALEQTLRSKVTEILEPHYSGHPITYNHYLTDNVQKAQNERMYKAIVAGARYYLDGQGGLTSNLDIEAFAKFVARQTEPNMERVAGSQAVDYMEAYYKVALKRTIDEISSLAVEEGLIRKLPALFTADTVYDLDDAEVRKIAGESGEVVTEQARLTQKLKVLQDGLHSLKRLEKRGTGNMQRNLTPVLAMTPESTRSSSREMTVTDLAGEDEEGPEPEPKPEPALTPAIGQPMFDFPDFDAKLAFPSEPSPNHVVSWPGDEDAGGAKRQKKPCRSKRAKASLQSCEG